MPGAKKTLARVADALLQGQLRRPVGCRQQLPAGAEGQPSSLIPKDASQAEPPIMFNTQTNGPVSRLSTKEVRR